MRLSLVAKFLFGTLALGCALIVPVSAQTNYTTHHFDNARDGWNNTEHTLYQGVVPRLAKYGTVSLDASVDAQPLYLSSEYITNLGAYYSTAYVATQGNSIYAIWPANGSILWSKNYGSPVSYSQLNYCGNASPQQGIQSTPVIDTATDTMYFVTLSNEVGPGMIYRLHAISPRDGTEKMPSMPINSAGPPFYPLYQKQRAALLEANGSIYVSFGSWCDFNAGKSYGRVMKFSASTLQRQAEFVTSSYAPCGTTTRLASVWGSGFGPAADANGYLYFATGNGCIYYTGGQSGAGSYAMAVLKLTPGTSFISTTTGLFADCHIYSENSADMDLSSGGVVLLPDQTGQYQHLAVAGGKAGWSFVLNRDNLGGFTPNCPEHLVYSGQTSVPNGADGGLFGGPVVFNQSDGSTYMAVGGSGSLGLRLYKFNSDGTFTVVPTPNHVLSGTGGASPIVTSDGTNPGSMVLWLLTRPTGNVGTINLEAYNASNLQPLFSAPAGSWSTSTRIPFGSPTVADGYVMVATDRQFTSWAWSGQAGPRPASVKK